MLCKSMIANPNDNLVFVFFNGFGSDYKFWENLIPHFSNYNYVVLSENYFEYPEDYGEDYLREIFSEKTIIGIGHSLGYHKLCDLAQKYDFFKMKKIVSIEGFSHYLGKFEPMKCIRKFYLDLMKNNYTFCPGLTLHNFMLMCGAPMLAIPSRLNKKLLMDDLDILDSGITPPKIPHLILSSLDDWVIPTHIIEDNFRSLNDVKIHNRRITSARNAFSKICKRRNFEIYKKLNP